MSLTRRVARPLLAAVFIAGGVEALRNPKPKLPKAEGVAPTIGETIGLGDDTEQLVQINAGAQVAGGVLLATGKLPRLASLVLAGSLIPTTAAGHAFWEMEDGPDKQEQQTHFLKNVSLLGGLLLAAVDTDGKPSLGWRAKRATKAASKSARKSAKKTRKSLSDTVDSLTGALDDGPTTS